MKYNRTILHPTIEDFNRSKYGREDEFYYERCKIGDLYDKWINIFENNNIKFLGEPAILKFNTYQVATPFTYKLNFNINPSLSSGIDDDTIYYILKDDDYKVFAKLFLIDGWEEELIYTFSARETKKINSNYSSNFGEIDYHTKSWVDYLTFQDSRIILQFRFDDYIKTELRKEKLEKLEKL